MNNRVKHLFSGNHSLTEQTTTQNQTVNLIKLTKLERKILSALLEGRKPSCPELAEYEFSEGNNYEGIAKSVYGNSVLHRWKRGGHFCDGVSICYAVKSSLCRSLKSLFEKGMVKKCHPIYRRGWRKAEYPEETSFYDRKLSSVLRAVSINEDGKDRVESIILQWKKLPYRCHVWWMLTEKGEKYAKEGAA